MSCARLWTMLREWGEHSGLRAVRVPHPEIQLGLPAPWVVRVGLVQHRGVVCFKVCVRVSAPWLRTEAVLRGLVWGTGFTSRSCVFCRPLIEELRCSVVSRVLSDGPVLAPTMRWSHAAARKPSTGRHRVVAPSPCRTKPFSCPRGGRGHAGSWSRTLDFSKAGAATWAALAVD